jgi:hypothetical protein
MKLKSFCTTKEESPGAQNGKKIFDSYTTDKELITRIHRSSKN